MLPVADQERGFFNKPHPSHTRFLSFQSILTEHGEETSCKDATRVLVGKSSFFIAQDKIFTMDFHACPGSKSHF